VKIRLAHALLLLIPLVGYADSTEMEIEYLLQAIGQSGCVFIRNGKDYSPTNAEKHLRKKYARAKKWVTNGEQFIERLASQSYLSGHPYFIRCHSDEPQPTGVWLAAKLASYHQ